MRNRSATISIRTASVFFAAWAVYSTLGQSGSGTLRVRILDKSSGQLVPAMVCITSPADNTWRTPPDGSVAPPVSTVLDFHNTFSWKPGDIGPVRLTTGEFPDDNKRSRVYAGLSAYPFWHEPAMYFVSRPFSITLPAGTWRLAVERGIEYLPQFEELEVAPNQTLERTIELARWVDMPAKGWYSGDPHVHYERTKPEFDEFLMTWARAEDVHVASILGYGDIRTTYMPQRAYGTRSHFQRGDYVLASGFEDPRNGIAEQGHVLTLNITAPVRDTSKYHLYDMVFDGIHAQGGLVGYAHLSNLWYQRRGNPQRQPIWDTSVNTIKGKIDFFEILQFRRLGLEDFYDFLNLGVKITATSGSDVPWGGTIGEVRTYAYTGRSFAAGAWYSALKQGRTFVTNGPMLTLSVNDTIPGGELRAYKGARLRISAQAWAPEAIGAPKLLEIVANGRVIQTAEARSPTEGKLQLQFDAAAASSQWIAARVTAFNDAVAHSSPVYVRVNGEGFADRALAPQLVEKRLKVLDYIAGRAREPQFAQRYPAAELEAFRARLQEARELYEAKLTRDR